MVFGPRNRTPCSRARRTISTCNSLPRSSASANPWLITTTRLMPMGRALLKRRHYAFPAQGDDRHVGDLRQIGHPGISLISQDLRHLGVHQVNRALDSRN